MNPDAMSSLDLVTIDNAKETLLFFFILKACKLNLAGNKVLLL